MLTDLFSDKTKTGWSDVSAINTYKKKGMI